MHQRGRAVAANSSRRSLLTAERAATRFPDRSTQFRLGIFGPPALTTKGTTNCIRMPDRDDATALQWYSGPTNSGRSSTPQNFSISAFYTVRIVPASSRTIMTARSSEKLVHMNEHLILLLYYKLDSPTVLLIIRDFKKVDTLILITRSKKKR